LSVSHHLILGTELIFLDLSVLDEDEIVAIKKAMAFELPSTTQDDRDLVTEDNLLHIADVLDGKTPLDASHAGGEFFQILEDDLQWEQK
jgi:hypothetical protein